MDRQRKFEFETDGPTEKIRKCELLLLHLLSLAVNVRVRNCFKLGEVTERKFESDGPLGEVTERKFESDGPTEKIRKCELPTKVRSRLTYE